MVDRAGSRLLSAVVRICVTYRLDAIVSVANTGSMARMVHTDPRRPRAVEARPASAHTITELARQLEESDDTVTVIATRCGFGSVETLCSNSVRRLGISPDQYRQTYA